ncbi:hypothetical protein TraAM80_05871 [Trypanosoma rangeli]|uniref:Uncharacterized protein n=1 Tax=Trypanosoma rangeli TaxID=5698 RepID=A0A3R7KBM1_TRYRA|nr:uncharacterized protein TraAM80_05871 [Trypanosoma rangeli]RNF03267.1 hypothetical protein TraAM80_05871 [Trypanosoma rangeli]|eukprot:RNF03267.1 hypothetical protein TraAM80_05871 [Trypanosoma rangeli]
MVQRCLRCSASVGGNISRICIVLASASVEALRALDSWESVRATVRAAAGDLFVDGKEEQKTGTRSCFRDNVAHRVLSKGVSMIKLLYGKLKTAINSAEAVSGFAHAVLQTCTAGQ